MSILSYAHGGKPAGEKKSGDSGMRLAASVHRENIEAYKFGGIRVGQEVFVDGVEEAVKVTQVGSNSIHVRMPSGMEKKVYISSVVPR